MKDRLLVVEGFADQQFALGALKNLAITNVEVFPPKSVGAKANGVDAVIGYLQTLISFVKGGSTKNLGIAFDADYSGVNGGFAERLQRIVTAMAAEGYMLSPPQPTKVGAVFSAKGLPDINIYIFPDHASDGMLETAVLSSIDASQSGLLSYALNSINSLPLLLFRKDIHFDKAHASTLMSWQVSPGCDFGQATALKAVDFSKGKLSGFAAWLKQTFP